MQTMSGLANPAVTLEPNHLVSPERDTQLICYENSLLSEIVTDADVIVMVKSLREVKGSRGIMLVCEDTSTAQFIVCTFAVDKDIQDQYDRAYIQGLLSELIVRDLQPFSFYRDHASLPSTFDKNILWEKLAEYLVTLLRDPNNPTGPAVVWLASLLAQEPVAEMLGLLVRLDQHALSICELSRVSSIRSVN